MWFAKNSSPLLLAGSKQFCLEIEMASLILLVGGCLSSRAAILRTAHSCLLAYPSAPSHCVAGGHQSQAAPDCIRNNRGSICLLCWGQLFSFDLASLGRSRKKHWLDVSFYRGLIKVEHEGTQDPPQQTSQWLLLLLLLFLHSVSSPGKCLVVP